MPNDEKKIQEEAARKYLSVSSIGRPYSVAEIPQIFKDMRDGLGTHLEPSRFSEAVKKSGTHAPKINSPRAEISGLNFSLPRKNSAAKTWVSGNNALGRHAKVLCRPIAILNEPGQESFIERLASGCRHAPALEAAFEDTFGHEALKEVKSAIFQGRPTATKITLWHENFPIFYLPGPDGSDIQASPAGYVDAYVAMDSLRKNFYERLGAWKNEERERKKAIKEAKDKKLLSEEEISELYPQKPRPPQVPWKKTDMSGHTGNIAIGINNVRTRLFVEFPEILDQYSSDLWCYAHKGAFPPLRNPEVPLTLVKYASVFLRFEKLAHKPEKLGIKLDQLADYAIRLAVWHIDDVNRDLVRDYPQCSEERTPPEITDLLASVYVDHAVRELEVDFDKDTVAGAMRSKHFASRLKLKGYAQ